MADALNGNGDARSAESIAGRAAAGEHLEPDEQSVLFPDGVIDGNPKTQLKNLIRSGQPVELTVSMRAAEVPLRGGLPDPEGVHRVLAHCELAKVESVAQREEGRITGWKVRAVLRPTYVEAAPTTAEAEQAAA